MVTMSAETGQTDLPTAFHGALLGNTDGEHVSHPPFKGEDRKTEK